jgi:hypothetical protein
MPTPSLRSSSAFSFSTYPIAQASIAYYSNIGLSGTVTTTITGLRTTAAPPDRVDARPARHPPIQREPSRTAA